MFFKFFIISTYIHTFVIPNGCLPFGTFYRINAHLNIARTPSGGRWPRTFFMLLIINLMSKKIRFEPSAQRLSHMRFVIK